jgi:outer membrane protein
MITTKLAAATAMMLAALTVASAQQATQAGVTGVLPDGKIAVINTAFFPDRVGELKQKYEQVQNQFQERWKRLQDLDQQLKQLEKDIIEKGSVLTQDKVQEMRETYDARKKQRDREAEDFQLDSNKALATATKPVWDKLSQFLTNYATQRGIILIIRLPEAYQLGTLAYHGTNVDVTEDFITQYNKANPVPAGAAPAGARPGATPPPQGPTKPKP